MSLDVDVFRRANPFARVQEFRLLEDEEVRQGELGVVEMLLGQDLRNNSVWNHRWFILHSTLGPDKLGDDVRIARGLNVRDFRLSWCRIEEEIATAGVAALKPLRVVFEVEVEAGVGFGRSV